ALPLCRSLSSQENCLETSERSRIGLVEGCGDFDLALAHIDAALRIAAAEQSPGVANAPSQQATVTRKPSPGETVAWQTGTLLKLRDDRSFQATGWVAGIG